MMKLAIVLLGGLVLAGCTSLVSAQSGCNSQHSRFLPMWDCVKGKIAANQAGDMNNDLGLKYVAFGEALAARVKAGQVSDVDAKYALATELSTSNTEYERRKADRAPLLRQTRCERDAGGNLNCTSW